MSSSTQVRDGLVVLVGNPAPQSRTSTVAGVVADALAAGAGLGADTVELAELGAAAIADRDDRVRRAEEKVADARVLVVATPAYKAAYTGLLKLFLDGLEPTALEGTVVIPVVLSASAAHGWSADVQLRAVLDALGAHAPVPSFVLEEHHLDHLPQYVDAWLARFGRLVQAVESALHREEVAAG